MNAIQPLVIIAALGLIIAACATHIKRGIHRNTVPEEWLFHQPAMTPRYLYELAGAEFPEDFPPTASIHLPPDNEESYLAFCEAESL